jgi:hypothetical protein
MEISEGTLLAVDTATGEQATMRALGPPTQGRDFVVVWVCTEHEFIRARKAAEEPKGIPWPYHAVHAVDQPEASQST